MAYAGERLPRLGSAFARGVAIWAAVLAALAVIGSYLEISRIFLSY